MLLFGPPENKLELLDGKTPCSFPFLDRDVADAHFDAWAKTLACWQGVPDPPVREADRTRLKEFGGFSLEQYRRPIRLEVPSDLDGYHLAHGCFCDRSLWPAQPAGFEAGREHFLDHQDIKHNLWSIFRDAQER